jgi:hypothetical protein
MVVLIDLGFGDLLDPALANLNRLGLTASGTGTAGKRKHEGRCGKEGCQV